MGMCTSAVDICVVCEKANDANGEKVTIKNSNCKCLYHQQCLDNWRKKNCMCKKCEIFIDHQ